MSAPQPDPRPLRLAWGRIIALVIALVGLAILLRPGFTTDPVVALDVLAAAMVALGFGIATRRGGEGQ